MKKEIKLGKYTVGDTNKCMIIAEISCNHLQDKDLAFRIIEEAKKAGADAVKFQAYTPDTMTLNPESMGIEEKANFMIEGSIWDGGSFYNLYQEAYTPWDWFKELKQKTEEEGLFFLVTPFDETSVDFLEKLGVSAYKIASFEINHIPLIKKIVKTNKPVIFSTGIAEIEDIQLALDTLLKYGNDQIIILKCTSSYPAPIEEANLMTIKDMQDRFKTLVGLSDHTTNAQIPAYAVALGACIVEKHFTLEKKGPDGEFSLLPDEFAKMVKNIRECESAMGKVNYELSTKVKEHRAFRRSIFASENIKSGQIFTKDNIRVIRPGLGMHPKYYGSIIGRKALRNIKIGEPINKKMVNL
ncbi:MAG TPA: pseudaminic acid synthase [Victivallales bacterium]|nr:pseudaminic acid synthase [Victivallales bacterium]